MRRLSSIALALSFASALAVRSATAATFTVNVLTDTNDTTPGDGVCADSVGKCSLRAALQEVGARSGGDTINFSLSGTIVLSNSLPLVSQPNTLIDGIGHTVVVQGGTVGGLTLSSSNNTVYRIAFTGFNSHDAVDINSGSNNNALQFLVIGGSTTASGISISGNNNTVTGCLVGTDSTGTAANANQVGVRIVAGSGNQIGSLGGRNVLSGNSSYGVVVDAAAAGNTIAANFIGTDVTGNSALPNSQAGISISGSGTIVGTSSFAAGGNVISGNNFYGIVLTGATNTTIEGNYIGIANNGTAALGNGRIGVWLTFSSSGTLIGGTGSGRNVISGTPPGVGAGVQVDSGVSGTTITGNFIGTDATGLSAIQNVVGVLLHAPATVGGSAAGAGNVISGNGIGIELASAGSGWTIAGNFIGVGVDGTTPLGNLNHGIDVQNASTSGTIGGTAAGAGNRIVGNGGTGVLVESGTSVPRLVAILGNSIHDNLGLGIDLAPGGVKGVTANDACDLDSGPNDLQNFPVITAASSSAGSTIIQGTLNSTASSTFRVELFASPTADPSGFGQGKTFLGAVAGNVNTDGSCNATWSITVPGTLTGQFITATATSAAGSGSTSEFSQAVAAIAGAGAPVLTISKSAPASVTAGSQLTYTITYGNTGSASASGVTIQDVIPTGATFASATAGGTLSGSVITWNIGSLGAGVTGQTVQFTVNVTGAAGTSLVNSTYLIAATGTGPVTGSPVITAIAAATLPPTRNIPATGIPGLIVLAGLLGAAGVMLLRMRG